MIPLGKPPKVAIVDAAARTDATDVRDAPAQYTEAAQLESEWRGRFRTPKMEQIRVGEGVPSVKFGF